MNKKLTHLDDNNQVNMVNISEKSASARKAVAIGYLKTSVETIRLLKNGELKKGEALTTAKIAGIMAAKKTSELIPLTHQISLDKIKIECEIMESKNKIKISSTCYCKGKTGVEIEALTAVSIACLTVYDMIKAVDPWAIIENIGMEEKQGGKNGIMNRNNNNKLEEK